MGGGYRAAMLALLSRINSELKFESVESNYSIPMHDGSLGGRSAGVESMRVPILAGQSVILDLDGVASSVALVQEEISEPDSYGQDLARHSVLTVGPFPKGDVPDGDKSNPSSSLNSEVSEVRGQTSPLSSMAQAIKFKTDQRVFGIQEDNSKNEYSKKPRSQKWKLAIVVAASLVSLVVAGSKVFTKPSVSEREAKALNLIKAKEIEIQAIKGQAALAKKEIQLRRDSLAQKERELEKFQSVQAMSRATLDLCSQKGDDLFHVQIGLLHREVLIGNACGIVRNVVLIKKYLDSVGRLETFQKCKDIWNQILRETHKCNRRILPSSKLIKALQ